MNKMAIILRPLMELVQNRQKLETLPPDNLMPV